MFYSPLLGTVKAYVQSYTAIGYNSWRYRSIFTNTFMSIAY